MAKKVYILPPLIAKSKPTSTTTTTQLQHLYAFKFLGPLCLPTTNNNNPRGLTHANTNTKLYSPFFAWPIVSTRMQHTHIHINLCESLCTQILLLCCKCVRPSVHSFVYLSILCASIYLCVCVRVYYFSKFFLSFQCFIFIF